MNRIAHYVLKRKLGAGAMGEVWLAEDSVLECDVAVKLIPAAIAQDPERRKRFLREAKLAAKLRSHPNVVTVLQAGIENDAIFVVMELVDGESLDETVASLGRLEWREATRVIRDAARGLAAAHELNLVHRDIKPANLMRTSKGVTKVVDFGLARDLLGSTDLTRAGTILGTPGFMAPEQWSGGDADARSDLYALICTYYFLLTARLPFDAPTILAVGYKHLHEPFPDPAKLVQNLPPEISRCMVRGAQKAQADRYQSATALIADLEKLLDDVVAKAVGGRAKPTAIPTSPTTLISPALPATPVDIQPLEIVTNSLGMKLTLIPAGEFLMGAPTGEAEASDDEQPQHRVQITQPFYLGVYAVTQQEYETLMEKNPSYFSRSGGGKERVAGQDTSRFPVEIVSWEDVVEFCRKLSEREEKAYRLPTEAEWEYAARAGSNSKWHFGDDEKRLGEYAWFRDNAGSVTHAVGQKKPNAWGLYDMHGNVWEWCHDWDDLNYYAQFAGTTADDPQGPTSPQHDRVLRGGSWRDGSTFTRSADRSRFTPGTRNVSIGFRLVCSPRTP